MATQRYAVCPMCKRRVRVRKTDPRLFRHLSETATPDHGATVCPNTDPNWTKGQTQ